MRQSKFRPLCLCYSPTFKSLFKTCPLLYSLISYSFFSTRCAFSNRIYKLKNFRIYISCLKTTQSEPCCLIKSAVKSICLRETTRAKRRLYSRITHHAQSPIMSAKWCGGLAFTPIDVVRWKLSFIQYKSGNCCD